jgi:hypothetical protein
VTNPSAREVLEELLQEGRLRAEGFPRLEETLTTAEQRRTPNPTLTAVFGLYVYGATRAEIANRLGIEPEMARNYITMIYHIFPLKPEDFADRKARRQRLAELAREEGFIP